MFGKAVLRKLDKELGSQIEVRRYNLSSMISESYKTLYGCESGTNMQKLVESHLDDVRKNPSDIERLSRQLAIIKEVQKLTESGEISDKDLDAATDSQYEGDVEKKVAEEREERQAPTEEIKESAEEVCPHCESSPCICESKKTDEEDLLEDTELTDEEVEALTQHLAEIRKNKKVTETKDTPSEEDLEEEVKYYQPTAEEAATIISRIQRKYGNEIPEQDYIDLVNAVLGEDNVSTDIIDAAAEKAGIRILGESCKESSEDTIEENRDFNWDDNLWAVVKDDGTYAGIPCLSWDEARELSYHPGSKIFKLVLDDPREDESKTYESLNLSEFRKKSSGKAFVKTFKKLDKQLHEGTVLTRQDAISLYKAANSAMTHLSVELEHNPEFQETFTESASLLSADVAQLLESMKKGKAPNASTMKSLAKFSEAMLREADEEEELPIEDEEDTLTDEEIAPETTEETPVEISEEEEEFDREYADARIELHKEMTEEHADDENPIIADKLTQDAEEILELPGITKEQTAEIQAELGETPAEEEEAPEDTDESAEPKEETPTEDQEEETPDLDLGGESDITDDELAELRKHLREMRSGNTVKESKGRHLKRRA